MITQTGIPATAKVIAVIEQTGTDTPTLDILVQTIEHIGMIRLGPGEYMIISNTGDFTELKTIINGDIQGIAPMLLSLAALNDYFIQFNVLGKQNISMDVKNAAGVRVELSSLQGGALKIPIDISIYNYSIPV